jgi:hypothetical protein
LPSITLDVSGDVTVAELEELARGMHKRLRITFENDDAVQRPKAGSGGSSETPARRKTTARRRRKMSPEGRAALIRNLEKAREAQAAKRRKAPKGA